MQDQIELNENEHMHSIPKHSQNNSQKQQFYYNVILCSSSARISRNKNYQSSGNFSPIVQLMLQNLIGDTSQSSQLQKNQWSKEIPIITPDNLFFCLWISTQIFISSINLLFIPLQVSFQLTKRDYPVFEIFFFYITLIFFILDFLLSFNLAIFKKGINFKSSVSGQLIQCRRIIITEYLKLEFWVDSATFTLLIIEFINPEIVNVLMLFRIIKIRKNFILLQNIFTSIPIIYDILQLLFTMICLSHFIACGWHLLGRLQIQESWLIKYDSLNDSWIVKYIQSVYWTITATVGYGDLVPVTPIEKVYSSIFSLYLSGFITYSMVEIGSIYSKLIHSRVQDLEELNNISYYLNQRGVNSLTRLQARKYLEYQKKQEVVLKAKEQINRMNFSMKKEINVQMYLKYIEKAFPNYSMEFKKSLCLKVQEKIYLPEEIIIKKGQKNSLLMFLISGTISKFAISIKIVYFNLLGSENGEYKCQFYQPKDQLLNLNQDAKFWIKSDNYVHMGIIWQEDLMEILNQYPSDKLIHQNELITFNCEICNKKNHQIEKCPIVFYQPKQKHLETIISQQNREFIIRSKNKLKRGIFAKRRENLLQY